MSNETDTVSDVSDLSYVAVSVDPRNGKMGTTFFTFSREGAEHIPVIINALSDRVGEPIEPAGCLNNMIITVPQDKVSIEDGIHILSENPPPDGIAWGLLDDFQINKKRGTA